MSTSLYSSVSFPKKGDEIFVWFNTSEYAGRIVNELFKAFVVNSIPDFSRDQEVCQTEESITARKIMGSIYACCQISYVPESSVHLFHTKFDDQPTPWSSRRDEWRYEDCDDDKDF